MSGAKQKTQKTAAKRVRRTGTAKLRVRHAYRGHLGTRKSERHKRRLARPAFVSRADARQISRLVPPSYS